MSDVLRLQDVAPPSIIALLSLFGLRLEILPDTTTIPGSYWQEDEAGIIGLDVLARMDTPIHSILHESCHTICMDGERRASLHTDAGGETEEEDAVCYLQILLADHIPQMGRQRMMDDMDNWGYTFRLGSASAWFYRDAKDAQRWLVRHGLLASDNNPTFSLRH